MMRDNIHKKVHRSATMAYQEGVKGNRVLFVFESPGRLEHQLNRPVAGETGAHLCMLCEAIRKKLHKHICIRFPNIADDICKDNASIINVATDYLPKKSSGGHKNSHELNTAERIVIAKELDSRKDFQMLISMASVVVCFGRLAWDMGMILESHLKNVGKDYIIIFTYHLSGRNSRSFTGDGWKMKMGRLAQDICECLNPNVNSGDGHTHNLTKFKYTQINL